MAIGPEMLWASCLIWAVRPFGLFLSSMYRSGYFRPIGVRVSLFLGFAPNVFGLCPNRCFLSFNLWLDPPPLSPNLIYPLSSFFNKFFAYQKKIYIFFEQGYRKEFLRNDYNNSYCARITVISHITRKIILTYIYIYIFILYQQTVTHRN